MSDDLWTTEESGETGPKELRALVEKLNKELKQQKQQFAELQTQHDGLLKEKKKSTLGELFTKAGAPPRLAKWAARDEIEATEEAVSKWIEENGEDFGFKPGQKEEEAPAQPKAESALEPEAQREIAGFNALDEARPGGGTNAQMVDKLKDLDARASRGEMGFDQLMAAFKEAGIPVGGASS